jgi:hypothetical protein
MHTCFSILVVFADGCPVQSAPIPDSVASVTVKLHSYCHTCKLTVQQMLGQPEIITSRHTNHHARKKQKYRTFPASTRCRRTKPHPTLRKGNRSRLHEKISVTSGDFCFTFFAAAATMHILLRHNAADLHLKAL